MRASSAFSAWLAVGVGCASIATMLAVMIAVMTAQDDATIAVALGQLGLVVVPVIVMRATHHDARALGLTPPRSRLLIAAALVGASTWYLNIRLVELLPFQPGDATLVQLVEQPSLPIVLVCVAIVPAVCEEILFRGALLLGLASQLRAWLAVLAAAIAFSLYHVNPIQMVPTLMLGLVFGLIALRGGSVIPTMLAHAMNNAIVLLVVRGELPTGLIDRHPTLALIGAGASTAAGVVLVRGPGRPICRLPRT